ncbi:Hsp20/alpha crystallin family protein [Crassaminicella thermophila]|uniref:Hsp20/alpha crystallin family protein n=1 Tax=Crassaminicella thermophila TaxID=2599308 RepID=A0A5C0SHF8_CRATE|nr:Hsp20/alpha crystallin family protein [Crassaminicella thermophila]QEK12854.1 Hsp20/alpha crystallin family protein [Crassaminicella thermophila]
MFRGLIPFSNGSRDVENFFEKMFEDHFGFPTLSTGMKVDIKENEKEYILEAEIPGANKEQIHIDYQNNYLTISVENINEVKEERENYIRRERKVGKSSRSFYIENIQHDNIFAKYENGILKVVLPKDENHRKRKRIEIQ